MKKQILYKKGFSLVELLVYISVLTIVVVAIISILFAITKSHRSAASSKLVQSNALFSIDRMTKEIHNARSINLAQSVLGTSPGSLSLNTIETSGATKTVEFYVQDGVLKIKENGAYVGQLTSSSTYVGNLVFRFIDQTRSDAVKLEMQLTAGTSTFIKTENFYNTTILRDSY